jgi:hypothetical protein
MVRTASGSNIVRSNKSCISIGAPWNRKCWAAGKSDFKTLSKGRNLEPRRFRIAIRRSILPPS